jgi:hypothetical protein
MDSNTTISSCPKCKGEMVHGFVPDHSQAHRLIGHWHEGRPKKSFFYSTKAPTTKGIPIGAYRCNSCGYLEFYANESFAAE